MAKQPPSKVKPSLEDTLGLRPGQSIELLKALHIVTRDGGINQDSRRKLKQVYHLTQFIEPHLREIRAVQGGNISLVDHGAGKSYLGFILYDLVLKSEPEGAWVAGVETRAELVEKSNTLARELGFDKGMHFVNLPVAQSTEHPDLPDTVDVVTALHACNTATDDAIAFGLKKQAKLMALVPCCQAEVATHLKAAKQGGLGKSSLFELWRHPLHTREFGSQLTNVLRCLQLEAHGYQVTVTELVGWEHSMKNELILARKHQRSNPKAAARLTQLLEDLGLAGDAGLSQRFFIPDHTGR
ncbi:MAG TPA: SAM-dependent methyltransferase [Limnobacter sp.]|uniref:class I SAM-dependent methyltransferase n=1 Tax=Limnobacter sp. TaxID=2003368 RepID=UPI002ED9284C